MKKYIRYFLCVALLIMLSLSLDLSKAQSAWQPNVAYSVGQLVTYQGHTYKCLQAHTSQVGWEPATTPALWQDMGPTSGGSTATNTPTLVPTNPPPTNPPPTTQPSATTGSGNGSPFSGTPYAVPGKIEAENYNTGGEGVAYHDSDATNNGGQYRTADGVDIEATTDTGGGYDLGWTATGEWEKYTVNVSAAGTYSIDFRVASNQTGGALHLEVDGANVTGSMPVPSTGGWQTWTTLTKSGVSLSAGQHVLRLFVDNTGYNINWINIYTSASATNTPTFVPTTQPTATSNTNGSPFSGSPYNLPGKVEVENYNTGGEGVAYHDSDTTNSGGQYRTGDGVDIEATTDTGGGYDVGWTATGEWMKYTVNVTTSGTYTFDFRVASAQSGSALHLEVDGTNVTGSLTVPNTGGWQTWTDVSKSGISLSAGQHVLRLFTDVGGMNYNWFNVYAGNPTATPTVSSGGWPGRVYAPYMEISVEHDYTTVANATGVKYFTLAFIIDGGSCQASWEGNYNMSSGFDVTDINNLRGMGGDVIVSFGGAGGNELALDCGDVASLQAQYQSVINAYHFTHLDFDIEGAAISNTAATDRRNKALANIQAANPNLIISYTLAVDTSGLPGEQISLLNNAVSNGLRVDVVNLMTMDYANDSRDMGAAATQAATSTVNQLKSVYPSKTTAQLWHMIGITPDIGINDTAPETFTIANAQVVLSFAQQNNIGLIAEWQVPRDHPCTSGRSVGSDTCSGISQSDYQFATTWKPFTQ